MTSCLISITTTNKFSTPRTNLYLFSASSEELDVLEKEQNRVCFNNNHILDIIENRGTRLNNELNPRTHTNITFTHLFVLNA